MKSALAVAAGLLGQIAVAHTPSSLIRTSGEPVEYVILDKATHTYDWRISVQTIYDMDTGFEWLQVEHNIEANFMATDQVEFELAFRTSTDPFIDNTALIALDAGICKMRRSTSDTRFWVLEASDTYYTCTD